MNPSTAWIIDLGPNPLDLGSIWWGEGEFEDLLSADVSLPTKKGSGKGVALGWLSDVGG